MKKNDNFKTLINGNVIDSDYDNIPVIDDGFSDESDEEMANELGY